MSPDAITQAITSLTDTFGADRVQIATEGTQTLVRLDSVELYPACQPPSTAMLLVFDPAQAKPNVYVTPGQTLANGRPPRNSSAVTVGGEPWLQFSFNIPWEERHGVVRFVAAARQRFIQDV